MSPQDVPPAGARNQPVLIELLGAAVALVAVIGATVTFARATSLFGRYFWFDEFVTYRIVADPSLEHALRAAAFENAPGLFLLLRGITALVDGHPEVTFRVVMLLAAAAGLLGVYALLRQVYGRLVSFAAVLVVWAHPLVLHHAFEARYYGPWLAATVWYAYFLARSRERPRSLGVNAGVAIASVAMCLVHYFGVITFALVLSFELVFNRSVRWRERGYAIGAALMGPLLAMPFAIHSVGERAAGTVQNWIAPPTLQSVWEFGTVLLLPAYLGGVLVLAWVARLGEVLPSRSGATRAGFHDAVEVTALAGLTATLLLPAVLIVMSYTVQPALLPRYALPAIAALALPAAMVLSRTSRIGVVAVLLLCGATGVRELRHQAAESRTVDQRTDELIATLREHTAGYPIVFEQHLPHDLCHYAPDLLPRCFYLDFELDGDRLLSAPRIFTRDWARRYADLYGAPGLMTWEELKRQPKRYVVPGVDPVRDPGPSGERYPGFTLRQVERGLYELVESRSPSRE